MKQLTLTPAQLLAWSSEANRAPSVHNVQPARFEWSLDLASGLQRVTLYSDQTRRLLAGDPLRIDEGTSLGAAWEGLRLAIERDGGSLEIEGEWLDPALSAPHPKQTQLRKVVSALVGQRALDLKRPDLLVEFVFKRKSYRGKFLGALPSSLSLLETALQTDELIGMHNTIMVVDSHSRAKVLRLLQDATARLARQGAVQAELLQWLRLDPRDPRYQEDGLNAEALEIPRSFASLARSLMQVSTHPAILKTGLNRALVDETPQTESASAVAILYAPVEATPLERGRVLYRSWLQMTRFGLSACPMSVLADDLQTSTALRAFHPQPETVRVLNVLRVGVSPRPTLPLTPRLQPERLIIQHDTRN